jgi:hypothetical protein
MIPFEVATKEAFDAWPVDRVRSGERRWAETTWGGDTPDRPKLFNWNIWPARVVIEVPAAAPLVRCEVEWRRSARSIRMRGLKLLSVAQNRPVTRARVVEFGPERLVFDFEPEAGAGLYHLYYGAVEQVCFEAPADGPGAVEPAPGSALAVRIEARCALDDFYPMETIALPGEIAQLLKRHPGADYLVFPEDRDRPIKLTREIPAHWAIQGPASELNLAADRNEYRVFQLGIWACRQELADIRVEFSALRGAAGAPVLPADRLQCLTRESRIRSRYIRRPSARFPVPRGAVRALWCGIDVPPDFQAGVYQGRIRVVPDGAPVQEFPLTLTVSDRSVPERGDHDLARLSRLRWVESDVGLTDRVYPPFRPLRWSARARMLKSWGHQVTLNTGGWPARIAMGRLPILDEPVRFEACIGVRPIRWVCEGVQLTVRKPGAIEWTARSRAGALVLDLQGRMEYDGSMVFDVNVTAARPTALRDCRLMIPWRRDRAGLASGMGYRGLRQGNRIWRKYPGGATAFTPSIWMGSIQAGLGFATWDTGAWEEVARPDAIRIAEEGDQVVLSANFGAHRVGPGSVWAMQFALLPTPVKPPDARHWDFRYIHKGGDFMPSADDTPASFLADNGRRLDELKAMGVRRLNLHDWWGPAFNYAWQWEGPDNLARLCREAHRRGLYVKVYNSGRELSTLAPEFRALLFEGAEYDFAQDRDDPAVEGRFQDAWHESHLPDGLPQGWPRLPPGLGNEHAVPVSNATRIGNFYLESMRYMTRFFGTDGAYWDGADGPTLGHREMAQRLWVLFRQTNPQATIDVHHGHALSASPISDHLLVMPFIDSLWHGEGFDYDRFDPWEWLVEISGLPFNVPSEVLGGDDYFARGLLFGIWSRAGWCAGTEKQSKLWLFFDRFGIRQARMIGFGSNRIR